MNIKCFVRGCGNSKHQTTGIHYSRFPQNERIRQKWIDICQVSPDKLENKMYACSTHFDDLCWTESKRLFKFSIPSLFLPIEESIFEISAPPKISNIKPTINPEPTLIDPLSNYCGNEIELDPLLDYCTCECEFDESPNLPEDSGSTEEPANIDPYSNYCTCGCEIDENTLNSSESAQVVSINSSILVTTSPTPQTVTTNKQTESPKGKGTSSSAESPTNLSKISEGNVENTISAEKDAIETDNNDKVFNPRSWEDEASLESGIFGNPNYLPHSSDYRPQSPPDPSTLTDNSDDEFESYFHFTDTNIRPRNYKLNENGRYECLLCDKIFDSQLFIRKHSETHEEKSSLCHLCGKLVKANLTAHIAMCKNSMQSIGHRIPTLQDRICPYCDKVSQSIFHHRDHLNFHTGEKPYQCVCGSRFAGSANFRTHRVKFGCPHPPKKIRESKRRTIVQKPKTSKRTRKSISDPNRYVCKECNLQCGTYDKYRFHIRTHITERNFICQLCNNSYRDKCSLDNHIRRKHLHKYECTICDKTFDTEGKLRNHLPEHQIKFFRCNLCENEENFPTLLGLRLHQRDIHKGIKKETKSDKFVCVLCETFHKTSKAFLRHLKTNLLHIKTEIDWKLKYNIKHYKCTFCSKLYNTFVDYSLHMRLSHTRHMLRKMEKCFEEFQSLENVETFNNDIIMKDFSNESNNDKCILSENVTTATKLDHLKANKNDNLEVEHLIDNSQN